MRKGDFLTVLIAITALLLSGCPKKEVKPTTGPEVGIGKEITTPPKPTEKGIGEEALKEREVFAKVEEAPALQPIFFDFDKYDIREDAKETLERNSYWLKRNRGARIQIEGHCDERGTNEYNLALGERRAKTTKDYLVSLGVERDRISTISFGEERPFDSGHNEEAWTKNRRAHFVILK